MPEAAKIRLDPSKGCSEALGAWFTSRIEREKAEAIHILKGRLYDGIRDLYLREEPGLLAAIKRGEPPAAREIINRVLVGIYHAARSRPELLKSLALELVVADRPGHSSSCRRALGQPFLSPHPGKDRPHIHRSDGAIPGGPGKSHAEKNREEHHPNLVRVRIRGPELLHKSLQAICGNNPARLQDPSAIKRER